MLEELGFTSADTLPRRRDGATHGRAYGYTYSDLAQRFLAGLVACGLSVAAITFDLAKEVIENTRLRLLSGKSSEGGRNDE